MRELEGNKLELDLTDYVVMGTLYCTDWFNNDGTIEMANYHINGETKEELTLQACKNCNDNKFGVQSYTGIEVDIYKNYEGKLVYYFSVEKHGQEFLDLHMKKKN